MPPRLPDTCPHETRPGTVVCLHCKHEARMAARAERQRKIGRVFAAVIVVAVIGAAASAGAAAMQVQWDWKRVIPTLAANFNLSSANGTDMVAARDESDAPPASAPQPAAETIPDSANTLGDSLGVDSTAMDSTARDSASTDSATATAPVNVATAPDSTSGSSQSAPQATPQTTPVATPQPAVGRVVPVIAEGRTELGDSVFALREGNIVTVHFDTPLGRTRRRDKFENMVRKTLPRIYGAAADSALAGLPWGALTSSGDLLADLPQSGIRLALPSGATMSIWPRTRPGRDGPLVVAYRAVVSR